MRTTIELTPENSAPIAEYSQLTGLTESELVNRLLADLLPSHTDEISGEAEWFLGTLSYPDRQHVERALARVIEIVRTRHQGNLPDSFRGEVRELPDGYFRLKAEITDRHRQLLQIC